MSKRAAKRRADPYFDREASKYSHPIPSRELILETLTDSDGPLGFASLATQLGLQEERDREALQRRLRAMERDGQLLRNRRDMYLPSKKADLIRGRVVGHPDGFGFLVPDEGGDDVYLAPHEMRSTLHGDRALVRMVGVDRRGRREGTLVEVLDRGNQEVVGRFFIESGIGFVVPDNKRINQDILVPPQNMGKAEHDQIVVAEIVEHPNKRTQPIGRIVEVLGEHMAPGMEIDVALRAHEIPFAWPPAVIDEAAAIDQQVPAQAAKERLDLRSLPLVTIDGEDARDFDDAVFAEPISGGWRLLVAIADVSAYVQPESGLDQEAHIRGTSVYFPERVIPMLPEALSNGICSLNPQVDRLCMVCEMTIGPRGKLKDFRFDRAVMRSHARLTYTEVAAILVEADQETRQRYVELIPHLEHLNGVYRALRQARERRGTIDFDVSETRIVFGENRKIERIVPTERNDAHRLIEECMIAANVAAAKFLVRHRMPTLFRVHHGPTTEKLADLRSFLAEFGISLAGGDDPEPKDYQNLLGQIQGRPDAHLIQTVLLRSLRQAQYAPENAGHFGLALEAYVHFTSPIRRYPDLLVHRAIGHILADGKPAQFLYNQEAMVQFGEHCSLTERRADDATRDAVDWLKCEYMLDKIGLEMPGTISGVTSFGLFVELDEVYVDGLVHITSLDNDYYQYDAASHRLRGERTGQVYRLGDRLHVKVMRVDLDERKIDFQLAESERPHQAAGKKRKSKRGKKTQQRA